MDDLILVKKRLGTLEKKKKHPLKSTDKEITDLLVQCQQTDVDTVKISSNVLFLAAQKNWIDLTSFVPELQLAIPTASHPHLLVFLLCNILRLPNSFQSDCLLKGHPLVSVVINQPSLTHHCITGSINLLKKYLDVNSLSITKPFFKYLLLHPNSSTQQHLADILHEQLLQLVREMAGQYTAAEESPLITDVLDLLINLAPFYQCSSIDFLWSTVYRISSLCKTIMCLVDNEKYIVSYTNQLIHLCLSICMECTSHGLPINEMMSNLRILFQRNHVTVSSCLCLSWLLMNHLNESLIVKSILEIVQGAVSSSLYIECLVLFKLPLILIVSQPFPSLTKSIRYSASELLSIIEGGDNIRKNEDVRDVVMITSSVSSLYTSLYALALNYKEYLEGNDIDWLEFVIKDISSIQYKSYDMVSLGIIMCSLEPVKTSDTSGAIIAILKKSSKLGSSILSYVIYTLGHVIDHQIRLNLLKSLPSFCTNSISTELVTRTLLTFTKHLDLLPMAIRLLGKAWEKNDKIFATLRNLFLPPLTGPCRVEWCIGSAATIRDICSLRPEVHGEECLSYISQLLAYSQHPVMISLLVSALNSLCLSNVIESPSLLWKLLNTQLASHDNPGIDKALCEFFSLAADIKSDTERPDDKVFRQESLKYLWKLTTKHNASTVQIALRTLTTFSIDSHTFEVLPSELVTILRSSLLREEEEGEENIDSIPLTPSQLLLLFLSLTRRQLEGTRSSCLDVLVKYLVSTELESLPRGVVYNAVKKTSSFGLSEKTRQDLEDFLNSMKLLIERGPTVLYLLNALRVKSNSSSPQKQRDYLLKTIRETLEFGTHNDLWTFNEGLLWSQLMNQLIEVEMKCVSSVRGAEKGEKRNELIIKTINKVLSTLKELVRHSVYCGMGVVLGVVCSNLSLETTSEFLSLLLNYVTCFLKTKTLPSQPNSPLLETLKILQTKATPDDFIKSFLHYTSLLSYCLSKYPWRALEVKQQLTELVTVLNDIVILKDHHLKVVELACSTLTHFIQDLPYCDKVINSCLVAVQFDDQIYYNKFSLLMVHVKGVCPLIVIERLLDRIQNKSVSIEDIQVMSLHISNNLPLLVAAGKVSFDMAMKCVQVLAELATAHDKIPELHLSLGMLIGDLYKTGSGVSLRGLMESLAVRWIQEGLTSLTNISNNNQLLSSLYGIAGLLGLSILNTKLKGCTNDDFIHSLISTSLPLLYQCCSISNQSIRNIALTIVTLVYDKFVYNKKEEEENTIPSDYDYLPEGSSLTLLYNQLDQYCTQSNGVIITDQQVIDIIKGLVLVKAPLPPVRWEFILLSLMNRQSLLCQESVIQFVLNQVSNNNMKIIRNVISFIVHPMIFKSLKESSQKEVINNLLPVMTSSSCHIFLVLTTSEHLLECSIECLLSLLSSENSCTNKSILSDVLKHVCQNFESQLKTLPDKELFQPSSNCTFFYTLSQCFSLSSVPVPDFLNRIITFCHLIIGDVPTLTLDVSDYLNNDSYTPLEEKWFTYTIQCLCSKQNNSYYETLLLTNLQAWSNEHTKPTDSQLVKLLSLMSTILGGEYISRMNIIIWPPVESLQDGVKQKLCELTILWLCDDREPLHSTIKSLICHLRHTSHFGKTTIWTSVAHLL